MTTATTTSCRQLLARSGDSPEGREPSLGRARRLERPRPPYLRGGARRAGQPPGKLGEARAWSLALHGEGITLTPLEKILRGLPGV
jgi:hypothetical protein